PWLRTMSISTFAASCILCTAVAGSLPQSVAGADRGSYATSSPSMTSCSSVAIARLLAERELSVDLARLLAGEGRRRRAVALVRLAPSASERVQRGREAGRRRA